MNHYMEPEEENLPFEDWKARVDSLLAGTIDKPLADYGQYDLESAFESGESAEDVANDIISTFTEE